MAKAVLKELSDNRALQTTFCSIICATRFKFFHKGALYPTVCQYCGGRDSLDHLLGCVNIGDAPLGDEDDLVLYVAELSKRAYNVNPGYPVPLLQGEGMEIDLLLGSDSDTASERDDEVGLDFEDDVGLAAALLEDVTGGERDGPLSSTGIA